MDIPTLLLATNALTAFVCLLLVGSRRKATDLLLDSQGQIIKLNTESTRLLQANDDLSREGITEERVRSAVYSNPNLIQSAQVKEMVTSNPELITLERLCQLLNNDEKLRNHYVDLYLKEQRITHVWGHVGNAKMEIDDRCEGEITNTFTDEMISEKCLRCGIIYRYFKGAGSPDMREYEGYFMGGHRLDSPTTPECLKLRLIKTEESP